MDYEDMNEHFNYQRLPTMQIYVPFYTLWRPYGGIDYFWELMYDALGVVQPSISGLANHF